MSKFPSYKSQEYLETKAKRKTKVQSRKLQTKRANYETSAQESFYCPAQKELH